MDSRLKLKFSKIFQSCHSKHTPSDVSNQPFIFPENHHHRQLIDLFSPKPKPNCHVDDKISNITPSFPAKKKTHYRKPKKINNFSSKITDNYYYGWRSSDEEDESDDETVMFSSRSFSSDSSGSFRKYKEQKKSKKKSKSEKLEKKSGSGGKLVKDSFAVVKKSSNPYEDFRVSMVEMIVEKEMFGVEDLEDLLECFISLNSEEHHRVIFEVFTEIWDALFLDYV